MKGVTEASAKNVPLKKKRTLVTVLHLKYYDQIPISFPTRKDSILFNHLESWNILVALTGLLNVLIESLFLKDIFDLVIIEINEIKK